MVQVETMHYLHPWHQDHSLLRDFVWAFGVGGRKRFTHLTNHSICLVESLLAVDALQSVYLRLGSLHT